MSEICIYETALTVREEDHTVIRSVTASATIPGLHPTRAAWHATC